MKIFHDKQMESKHFPELMANALIRLFLVCWESLYYKNVIKHNSAYHSVTNNDDSHTLNMLNYSEET